jgi:hypothetical protein
MRRYPVIPVFSKDDIFILNFCTCRSDDVNQYSLTTYARHIIYVFSKLVILNMKIKTI